MSSFVWVRLFDLGWIYELMMKWRDIGVVDMMKYELVMNSIWVIFEIEFDVILFVEVVDVCFCFIFFKMR